MSYRHNPLRVLREARPSHDGRIAIEKSGYLLITFTALLLFTFTK